MWRAEVVLAGAVVVLACGGEQGPSNDEIYGTWRATKVEYADLNSAAKEELISLGGTATLVLNRDMSGTYTYTPPGGQAEVRSFTWSRDGENITWQYQPGNDDNFRVALASGTLQFYLNVAKSYDCDHDGELEQVSWSLAFVR